MTVKALEVRLNGKKLYTVGIKDWRMLGANVAGTCQTLEDMALLGGLSDQPLPEDAPYDLEHWYLTAYAGVPDPSSPGSSSGQQYDSHSLSLGDEVTIKLIETDQPDNPLPPHPSGPGVFALKSSSDSE